MVKYYEVNESSFRSLLKWNETILKDILVSFEYWLYVVVLLAFTALFDYDVLPLPDGLDALDIKWIIGPVISVAIFSVVFYQNQCYTRYFALYTSCCQVDTAVKVLVMEMITDFDFDPDLRPMITQAVKYIVSSCTYFYTSYGGEDGMTERCWDIFEFKGLLTQEQLDFAKEYPGDTAGLFLFWAQQVCREMIMSQDAKTMYSAPELAAMTSRLYGYIDKVYVPFRDVMNLMKMPIPFPYFHMLNTMVCFALTLSGFGCLLLSAKADSTYFASAAPFMLVAYGLLALRRMGAQLSNPFGFDPVDFPTSDFIRHIHDECSALLRVKPRFDALRTAHTCNVFTAEDVDQPCHVETARKGKKCDRQTVALAQPEIFSDDWYDYNHKPRLWTKPEDFSYGHKVAQWIKKGLLSKERSSNKGGFSNDDDGEIVVDGAEGGRHEETTYAEEPIDMQMLRAMQHMGGKMHDLLRTVERNSQTLGMQPKKEPMKPRKDSFIDGVNN